MPKEYRLEQQYGADVNFVMLDIDNSKWAPEVTEYGVAGIPHFVWMGADNAPLAAAVGTPVYVYSAATLRRHYTVLRDALVAEGLKDPGRSMA